MKRGRKFSSRVLVLATLALGIMSPARADHSLAGCAYVSNQTCRFLAATSTAYYDAFIPQFGSWSISGPGVSLGSATTGGGRWQGWITFDAGETYSVSHFGNGHVILASPQSVHDPLASGDREALLAIGLGPNDTPEGAIAIGNGGSANGGVLAFNTTGSASGLVAVSGTGCASGSVAASSSCANGSEATINLLNDANARTLAASGTGCATAYDTRYLSVNAAVSGTGCANATADLYSFAVSGAGCATGWFAISSSCADGDYGTISGTGDAYAEAIGVSGLGNSSGCTAVSGTGDATACGDDPVYSKAISGTGDANGGALISVSGTGSSNESAAVSFSGGAVVTGGQYVVDGLGYAPIAEVVDTVGVEVAPPDGEEPSVLDPVYELIEPSNAETTSTERCWEWGATWYIRNRYGNVYYAWKEYVLWCARSGRITRVPSYWCQPGGGFFEYLGCTKEKGPNGLGKVRVSVDWRFRCCRYYYRYPSTDIDFKPDGTLTGTVNFG